MIGDFRDCGGNDSDVWHLLVDEDVVRGRSDIPKLTQKTAKQRAMVMSRRANVPGY